MHLETDESVTGGKKNLVHTSLYFAEEEASPTGYGSQSSLQSKCDLVPIYSKKLGYDVGHIVHKNVTSLKKHLLALDLVLDDINEIDQLDFEYYSQPPSKEVEDKPVEKQSKTAAPASSRKRRREDDIDDDAPIHDCEFLLSDLSDYPQNVSMIVSRRPSLAASTSSSSFVDDPNDGMYHSHTAKSRTRPSRSSVIQTNSRSISHRYRLRRSLRELHSAMRDSMMQEDGSMEVY